MSDLNPTATKPQEPEWNTPGSAEPPTPATEDATPWETPGSAQKPKAPDVGLMVGLGGGCYRQGGECNWAPQVTLRLNHPLFTIEGQQAGPAALPIRGYAEVGAASNGEFSSVNIAAPVMFLDPEFFHISVVPRLRIDNKDDAWSPVGELALRVGLKAYKNLSVSFEYGPAWWNIGGSDPQQDYFWNADSFVDGMADFCKPGTASLNLKWFF